MLYMCVFAQVHPVVQAILFDMLRCSHTGFTTIESDVSSQSDVYQLYAGWEYFA